MMNITKKIGIIIVTLILFCSTKSNASLTAVIAQINEAIYLKIPITIEGAGDSSINIEPDLYSNWDYVKLEIRNDLLYLTKKRALGLGSIIIIPLNRLLKLEVRIESFIYYKNKVLSYDEFDDFPSEQKKEIENNLKLLKRETKKKKLYLYFK